MHSSIRLAGVSHSDHYRSAVHTVSVCVCKRTQSLFMSSSFAGENRTWVDSIHSLFTRAPAYQWSGQLSECLHNHSPQSQQPADLPKFPLSYLYPNLWANLISLVFLKKKPHRIDLYTTQKFICIINTFPLQSKQ